ncbi:MAG: hypothetical protein KDA83_13350, partial [Planctomycetales bacterium]|nr:hypothetical protein [Planctomycetales bacterium]
MKIPNQADEPRNPVTLSTSLTTPMKVIFPAVYLIVGGTVMTLYVNSFAAGTLDPFSIAWFSVGSLILAYEMATVWPLKQVKLHRDQLLVSCWGKNWKSVPVSRIESVECHSGRRGRILTIHFRSQTVVGEKLSFMPYMASPYVEHPVQTRLQALVHFHDKKQVAVEEAGSSWPRVELDDLFDFFQFPVCYVGQAA